MDFDAREDVVYENILMTRFAAQNAARFKGTAVLDRSATILLARLEAQGPMSVGELAEAFELDVSTVHRQVTAAIKNGLIERVDDRKGGAARLHRPTSEGSRKLAQELAERKKIVSKAMADWSEEDIETYVKLIRRYNKSIENLRGQPWPRADD